MKTVYDKIEGPLVVASDMTIHGMVTRQVTVTAGSTLHLHGMVTGDLIVEPEARAFVHGMVNGTVFNKGGLIEINGMVDRIVSSPEGLTAIAPTAVVRGGV